MKGRARIASGKSFPDSKAPVIVERIVGYLGTVAALGIKQQYDVTPDGQRFLLNVERGASAVSPITVVLNWTKAVTSDK